MNCTKCNGTMDNIATFGNKEVYECTECGHVKTTVLNSHILTIVEGDDL